MLAEASELGRLLDEKLILNEALARKKEIRDMRDKHSGGGQEGVGNASQESVLGGISSAGPTGISVEVTDGIDAPGMSTAGRRGQLQLFLGHVQGGWRASCHASASC